MGGGEKERMEERVVGEWEKGRRGEWEVGKGTDGSKMKNLKERNCIMMEEGIGRITEKIHRFTFFM